VSLDHRLAERLQRPDVQEDRALRRAAFVLRRASQPGVLLGMPALWAAGRLAGDRSTATLGLRASEAAGATLVTTGLIKLVAGRQRPYVEPREPGSWRLLRGLRGSGLLVVPLGPHRRSASRPASRSPRGSARRRALGARRAALRDGCGDGWSRMYEDRHWASDVAAGAAVGTLGGLAVSRWHRGRPRARVDRWLLGASLGGGGGAAARGAGGDTGGGGGTLMPGAHGVFVLAHVAGRQGRPSARSSTASIPSSRVSRRRT
jgi:hypothetical protein